MSTANELVVVERNAGVMVLTLNRPDVLNSFNRAMARELLVALETAQADPGVRAILITGAGRAFCAGQDLADVPPPTSGDAPDLGEIVRASYNPLIRILRSIEKPVVCAVNGVAAGAGANLAFACDIILAASHASFIQSFSKIGLIPDSGGTYFLPRLVGLQMATALTMLGDKVSADRAHELGMVYRVVNGEVLLPEALELAGRLAQMPTRGLGLTKRGLNASLQNELSAQLEFEEDLQRQAGRTADFAEGVAAFLGKREPRFRGE